jgi:hypothetical protein
MELISIHLHPLLIDMLLVIARGALLKIALLFVHLIFAFFISLVALMDQLQMPQCTHVHNYWTSGFQMGNIILLMLALHSVTLC